MPDRLREPGLGRVPSRARRIGGGPRRVGADDGPATALVLFDPLTQPPPLSFRPHGSRSQRFGAGLLLFWTINHHLLSCLPAAALERRPRTSP